MYGNTRWRGNAGVHCKDWTHSVRKAPKVSDRTVWIPLTKAQTKEVRNARRS